MKQANIKIMHTKRHNETFNVHFQRQILNKFQLNLRRKDDLK